MEDLIELDAYDPDKQKANDELIEGKYNDETFWPDLVIFASLLLRGREVSPISDLLAKDTGTEHRNYVRRKILEWFADDRDLQYQYEIQTTKGTFIEDRLPDVCGACFHSYGLCVSGRIRHSCSKCFRDKETSGIFAASWNRYTCLSTLVISTEIRDAVLSQIIYKYYSPNGDKQWQMKNYRLSQF